MTQFSEFNNYIIFSNDIPEIVLPRQLSPEIADIFVNSSKNGIYLGRSEYLNIPIFWNSKLYPNGHCCVIGMSGSGKTYFVKTFIARATNFSNARIIIIDWTNEYVDWARDNNGRILDMRNFSFDIFPEPEEVHEKLADTIFILSILSDLSDNESAILHDLINEFYLHRMKKPDFNEFINICKNEKSIYTKISYHYDDLKRLFKNVGNFEDFLRNEKILCLDFSKAEKDRQRVVFSHIIINMIASKMRFFNSIETFIVIDEAWRLLKKKSIEKLVREGRKYLHNVIFASQNAVDFGDIVFSNFSSFFVFKLQSHNERKLLAKSLQLSDEIVEKIGNLPRGKCFCRFTLTGKQPINFFVKRIEGEEGIIWYLLRFDNMEMSIEREVLIRRLKENNIRDNDIQDILNYLDLHNRTISIVEIVKMLEERNYSTAQLISLMRSIQINDEIIVNVLAELDEKEGTLNAIDIDLDNNK